MLKSDPFEVSLADKQSIILPETSILGFIENNHKRIKINVSFEGKRIEFYAALKKKN